MAIERGLQEAADLRAVVTACPVCRGHGPFQVHRLHEMLFGTRESFDYGHCPDCGVLWLLDPPDDLSPYYPEEYHALESGDHADRTDSAARRELRRWRGGKLLFGGHRYRAGVARRLGVEMDDAVTASQWLVRQAGLRSFDDPILDVGCGPVPERLAQLRAAGFRRLLGADPFIARDTTYRGIRVLKRDIEQVEGTFAFISFHHSFEHLADPRAALAAATRLLRPGGVILIRTPVMGGWFWRTYGVDWWELDPPRHLFVHSTGSLRQLAADVGLEVANVAFDSTYLEIIASDQYQRRIPWRSSTSYWADPAGTRETDVAHARRQVEQLNLEGSAGRAQFFLRRV